MRAMASGGGRAREGCRENQGVCARVGACPRTGGREQNLLVAGASAPPVVRVEQANEAPRVATGRHEREQPIPERGSSAAFSEWGARPPPPRSVTAPPLALQRTSPARPQGAPCCCSSAGTTPSSSRCCTCAVRGRRPSRRCSRAARRSCPRRGRPSRACGERRWVVRRGRGEERIRGSGAR